MIKDHPYWLDQLDNLPRLSDNPSRQVDVLIIGSGYTGLHAAIQTARAGRTTLVIDSQQPGFGCSTRNGGQISTSVKPSLEKLAVKYGQEKAKAIRGEGKNALQWFGEMINSEQLDCDFRRAGRFHAAHTPKHYDMLAREAQSLRDQEGIDSFMVTKDEQHNELGTDVYHGGVVFPSHCSIHPAKYHHELLRIALASGVQIVGFCSATKITPNADAFSIATSKGKIQAREVVVATNGYTSALTPWLQRRVIPIGSYIIATEALPESVVDELFPTDRIASDTCKVIYYYRASPDRRRILFGGRVSASETDPAKSALKLQSELQRIFPQLEGCGISHTWSGMVAYTFDELAHTGVHEGIYYAMGYCGSGVSMASYLGMKTGLKVLGQHQKVLGQHQGNTAFDNLPNPTRPFYTGRPWFLPGVVAYYRWQDRWQHYLAARKPLAT